MLYSPFGKNIIFNMLIHHFPIIFKFSAALLSIVLFASSSNVTSKCQCILSSFSTIAVCVPMASIVTTLAISYKSVVISPVVAYQKHDIMCRGTGYHSQVLCIFLNILHSQICLAGFWRKNRASTHSRFQRMNQGSM